MFKRHMTSILLFIVFVVIVYFSIEIFSLHISEAKEVDSETTAHTNNMEPFYWTVGIVGGCIAITLSYVSWRKYKGEEKKRDKKNSNS